jgi:hypothetical protein
MSAPVNFFGGGAFLCRKPLRIDDRLQYDFDIFQLPI